MSCGGCPSPASISIADEVARLSAKAEAAAARIYAKLTPWQKTQVARHPDRPLPPISRPDQGFHPARRRPPLATTRRSSAGSAASAAAVMVIGPEKGRDTEGRVKHNFGMARPEGYRKALRLMHMADKFRLPVITLVDTPGAFPGSMPRRAARPRPSRAAIEACLDLRCRSSPTSSARAARAGRSRSAAGQPGDHAGACGLYGDLAGGLRLDPVARRREGAGGGGGVEHHRRMTCAGSSSSTGSCPSPGRRASGPGGDDRGGGRCDRPALAPLTQTPEALKARRRKKFLAMGKMGLS